MKKLLISVTLLAVLALWSGCKSNHYFITECIYVNNSSSELTMFVDRVNARQEETRFIIPVGGSHTLKFADAPLSMSEYVTVSNGEKTITHSYYNRQTDLYSLYDEVNYTIVESGIDEYRQTLSYTFNDAFFDDTL